jgi:AcrR family transcriptional regulator
MADGLRERKKAEVRRVLVDSALRAYIEQGYDATTIDDIVAAAMVSRRTFFRYFDSKDAVVLAWLDDMCAQIIVAFEARPAREEPLVALRHAFAGVLAVYEADRAHFLAVERLVASTAVVRAAKRDRMFRLTSQLAAVHCKRSGEDPRRALVPRVVANASAAVVDAAIETWLARGGKVGLIELIDEGFVVLARTAAHRRRSP